MDKTFPKPLADKWVEAGANPGTPGGILVASKAICPACTPRWLENLKRYGEENHIKARCDERTSFADWVRSLRGPDAAITITGC